jgi:hypothetical protein
MWGSKGRSGYGDSTIGGDYDSWAELSPNGKQWKNPITMLTRDLSGADYWHLRKQNRPTEEIPAELHMLKSGKANINAYADPVPTKKASTASIKDKILPQAKRLTTLREQMVELENSYRAGEMSISEYSQLRDIVVAKIQRQEILYKRAASVKPIRPESYEDEVVSYTETFSTPSDNNRHGESYSSPVVVSYFAEVIDELSDQNSFKSFLQITCKLVRKAVQFSQATRNYIKTLSEV